MTSASSPSGTHASRGFQMGTVPSPQSGFGCKIFRTLTIA